MGPMALSLSLLALGCWIGRANLAPRYQAWRPGVKAWSIMGTIPISSSPGSQGRIGFPECDLSASLNE